MDMNKKKEVGNGFIISMLALFLVYLILTIGVASIFQYYTMVVSEGEFIFYALMCWQVALFAIEAVTIIVQGIMLLKIMSGITLKRFQVLKYVGILASVIALVAAIWLIAIEGFVLNPVGIFIIYALLITGVRGVFIPYISTKQYLHLFFLIIF